MWSFVGIAIGIVEALCGDCGGEGESWDKKRA